LPVRVKDEPGRGGRNVEPRKDRIPELVPSQGAVEDELFQEIGVFGAVVKLLDQQFAVPSAALLGEIDEDGLVLFLGRGQRGVDRPADPRLGDPGHGGDKEKSQNRNASFHLNLP
jgi:hypothetical protein